MPGREFCGVLVEYNGGHVFNFWVGFSDAIEPLRAASFTVSGGNATGTQQVDGRSDL